MDDPTEGGSKVSLLKIHIPDDKYVWLSANIVEEEEDRVPTKDEPLKKKKVTLEITEPAFLDSKEGGDKLKTMYLDYQTIVLQNSNEHMPRDGVDDMVTLNFLHEASILDNLRRRFQARKPYTYTGGICVAVNPYAWLDIYTDKLKVEYSSSLRHELKPHAYATSAQSYRSLTSYGKNQSILVSGESGAGKTETVKILMKHIAYISAKKSGKVVDGTIIERILQSNPLLETFGNAQTLRNDNSSRFGKFTQMHFDEGYQLSGSRCVTYLLEKSRVVGQSAGERNYHIFHVVTACPEEMKSELCLEGKTAADFRYLNGSNYQKDSIEGVLDSDRFTLTMDSLAFLGVSKTTRRDLARVLTGILYLGQTTFTGDDDKSHLLPTESTRFTCELLGLNHDSFKHSATHRTIIEPGSSRSMSIPLGKSKAESARDAWAKDIYERLFLWLVAEVNKSTVGEARAGQGLPLVGDPGFRTISLLDIFGFESFEVNKFEQLCINFANEKLQQKFTSDFFSTVQQEYRDEGLEWDKISYKDNAEVLGLLEGRVGVFSLLDEECKRNIADPSGLDASFLNKLRAHFDRKHPKFYRKPRMGALEFGIAHYAADVTYHAASFVQRNKDALPVEVTSFMMTSANPLVARLFAEDRIGSDVPAKAATAGGGGSGGRGGPSRRASFMMADTVLTKFRRQLTDLMDTIAVTEVQYVRCVKPNSIKSDGYFDRHMVTEQLRCAGMIEAIRISRAAYPYRVLHSEFVERFGLLHSVQWTKEASQDSSLNCAQTVAMSERATAVLRYVLPDHMHSLKGSSDKDFEIGRTKTYFSSAVLSRLEEMRRVCVVKTRRIQACARGYMARKVYQQQRRRIKLCQAVVRGLAGRGVARQRRRAMTTLQNFMASRLTRQAFLRSRGAVTIINAWVRRFTHMRRYVKMLAEERERQATQRHLELMKARLREEAETAASVQQERDALRQQVEELLRAQAQTQAQAQAQVQAQVQAQAQAQAQAEKERERENALPASTRARAAETQHREGEQAGEVIVEKVAETRAPAPTPAPDRSEEELAALESVQKDVQRLQKALADALAANDEMRATLTAQRQDAESKAYQEKVRFNETSDMWRKEKTQLMQNYIETTHLLDEAHAQIEQEREEKAALRRQIGAGKSALAEKERERALMEARYFEERRARLELVEAVSEGGRVTAALVERTSGGAGAGAGAGAGGKRQGSIEAEGSEGTSPSAMQPKSRPITGMALAPGGETVGSVSVSSGTSVSSHMQTTGPDSSHHGIQSLPAPLTAAGTGVPDSLDTGAATGAGISSQAPSPASGISPGKREERRERRRSRRNSAMLMRVNGSYVANADDDGADNDHNGLDSPKSAEELLAAMKAEHLRRLREAKEEEISEHKMRTAAADAVEGGEYKHGDRDGDIDDAATVVFGRGSGDSDDDGMAEAQTPAERPPPHLRGTGIGGWFGW